MGIRTPDFKDLEIYLHDRPLTIAKIDEDGKIIKIIDPSKEIKKDVWDGLSESARNELKSKGFYCEGDEIDADDDNFRVIQSDDF